MDLCETGVARRYERQINWQIFDSFWHKKGIFVPGVPLYLPTGIKAKGENNVVLCSDGYGHDIRDNWRSS